MTKTLAVEATAVATVERFGEKLILPEKMSLLQAVDLIQRRMKYEEEVVVVDETFDVFPWDGANALAEVLTKRYGWVPAEASQGFFGNEPPKMITIATGPSPSRPPVTVTRIVASLTSAVSRATRASSSRAGKSGSGRCIRSAERRRRSRCSTSAKGRPP